MGKPFPATFSALVEYFSAVKEHRTETARNLKKMSGRSSNYIGTDYQFKGKLIAGDKAGR